MMARPVAAPDRVRREVLPGKAVLVRAVADLGRDSRQKRGAGGDQGGLVLRSLEGEIELVHDPRDRVVRHEVRRLVGAPGVGVLAEPALVGHVEGIARLLPVGVQGGAGDGHRGAGADPEPLRFRRRGRELHQGLLDHDRAGGDDRAKRLGEPRPRHELRRDLARRARGPPAQRGDEGRRQEARASRSHSAPPLPRRRGTRSGTGTRPRCRPPRRSQGAAEQQLLLHREELGVGAARGRRRRPRRRATTRPAGRSARAHPPFRPAGPRPEAAARPRARAASDRRSSRRRGPRPGGTRTCRAA